jgi:hypothetical protein
MPQHLIKNQAYVQSDPQQKHTNEIKILNTTPDNPQKYLSNTLGGVQASAS